MDRHQRLRRLCAAVDDLVERVPGFEGARSTGGGADEGICRARFTSSDGAVATLSITPDAVVVTTRSADQHPEAGRAEIEDRLGLDLTGGFAWDDVECSSAEQLAELLLKHMYRRTGHAAPEPQALDGPVSPPW